MKGPKLPWFLKKVGPPYQNEEGHWIIDLEMRKIYWWWFKLRLRQKKLLTINLSIKNNGHQLDITTEVDAELHLKPKS